MQNDPLITRLHSALLKPFFIYKMARAQQRMPRLYSGAPNEAPLTPRQRGADKVVAKAEAEIREAVLKFVQAGGLGAGRCVPDPKHPGFFICPDDHDGPHVIGGVQ